MSKIRSLRHALLSPEEVEAAMGVVALTPEITPELLGEITQDYIARCEAICGAMEDLVFDDDESEAEKHIPLTWLATRYEWSRYNDQMQYQTMLQGAAQPRTMALGSMLSKIAEKLETLQDRRELFWTLKLAADPFGTVERIHAMSDRMMAITAATGRGVGEVMQELYSVREMVAGAVGEAITGSIADRGLLEKLDKGIARSIEAIDATMGIELGDLHAALEAEMVRRLAHSRVTALLETANRASSELIPPDICDLFFVTARDWLEHLFAHSLESSPEEREANGKSAHLTLTWRIARDEKTLTFILADDGLGTGGFEPRRTSLQSGLTVRHSHMPGQGSELIVEASFMMSGNAEYLSFSTFNGTDHSRLAIPAQYVSFIEQVEPARLRSAARVIPGADGSCYSILDLSRAVFGASADYPRNLIVFADLGAAGKPALRVEEVHGISRGRVKPLPMPGGHAGVAGVLNTGTELTLVLDIEGMLGSCS
ncbi:MAG: chemotaxis protein CheW [Erythrobacter sp.]|nr:chemotaxis protein CheW [Erythrobacter sp.]